MKKKKKFDYVIGTPETRAWMREIERKVFFDNLKPFLPLAFLGLIVVVFFLSLFYSWGVLVLYVLVSGGAGVMTYFMIMNIISAIEQPRGIIEREVKEIHHYHTRPSIKMTEVREVKAKLPNGTEYTVRQGRRYE